MLVDCDHCRAPFDAETGYVTADATVCPACVAAARGRAADARAAEATPLETDIDLGGGAEDA